MTLLEKRRPIYFLKTNPYGWKRASLAKLQKTAFQVLKTQDQEKILCMPWSERDELLNTLVLQRQERCWEQETGVKPENTHFTLIVPVHDEENSLPSFLGTFMLSDIPSAVNMQVVFVTNACSDASIPILLNFLSGLGTIEKRDVIGDFADPNIHPSCNVVEKGHMTFIHLDTSTAGKANALGIGNVLAHMAGHIITMSLDANNFVEPDAIRALFAHAHKAFRNKPEPNDIVLFGSIGIDVVKTSRAQKVLDNYGVAQQHLVEGEVGRINGWMMAWNNAWMLSIGGPPGVALEDYALGVLARVQNYRFHEPEGVLIWGYVAHDFRDMLETRARHVRGKKQICDYFNYDPTAMSIIESESFYMKRFPLRVKYLLDKVKKNPPSLPRYAVTFLIWEYAIWKGMREYKRNPKNQSWKKIASTF
jgi:cellulose synthase/poly-beta-1,6-N-acetylglucosamine synthase-like glycosyltransferase